MISKSELFKYIIQEVQASRPVAWCVVVETTGSTPQVPGAMMVVDMNSQMFGTIGGGCVEGEVRKQAFLHIQNKTSSIIEVELNHETVVDDGLICGGSMMIAVVSIFERSSLEPFQNAVENLKNGKSAEIPLRVEKGNRLIEYRLSAEPEPSLLIAGAGHIGRELADLAVKLDFKVVVVDTRADFACPSRFPPPIELKIGEIGEILKTFPIDTSTYVVIVTRGHRHDLEALEAVIDSPAKYIGMIGSQRKVNLIFKLLSERGTKLELLKNVFAPIWLSINAVTVPEIALSIAAQLVQIRRAAKTELVRGPF